MLEPGYQGQRSVESIPLFPVETKLDGTLRRVQLYCILTEQFQRTWRVATAYSSIIEGKHSEIRGAVAALEISPWVHRIGSGDGGT
jgi:hypothetical protein